MTYIMKKTVFMLAAIAALLMSCEKNESEDIKQSENPGTASKSVTHPMSRGIPLQSPSTRYVSYRRCL